jgi:hypothetical protein
MWVMQMDDSKVKEIEQRYNAIEPFLNERTRRLFSANEALVVGWGGITLLSRITGLTRNTIMLGCDELQGNSVIPFPMKVVPDNINLFHLIIRYFDTFWIFILIQFNGWRRYLPARAAGSAPSVRP